MTTQNEEGTELEGLRVLAAMVNARAVRASGYSHDPKPWALVWLSPRRIIGGRFRLADIDKRKFYATEEECLRDGIAMIAAGAAPLDEEWLAKDNDAD